MKKLLTILALRAILTLNVLIAFDGIAIAGGNEMRLQFMGCEC